MGDSGRGVSGTYPDYLWKVLWHHAERRDCPGLYRWRFGAAYARPGVLLAAFGPWTLYHLTARAQREIRGAPGRWMLS